MKIVGLRNIQAGVDRVRLLIHPLVFDQFQRAGPRRSDDGLLGVGVEVWAVGIRRLARFSLLRYRCFGQSGGGDTEAGLIRGQRLGDGLGFPDRFGEGQLGFGSLG
jgi:hypothetical protein